MHTCNAQYDAVHTIQCTTPSPRALGRPSARRSSSASPSLTSSSMPPPRSGLRFDRAAAHLLPTSSSVRRLATSCVGTRPLCVASISSRAATSAASSCTQPASRNCGACARPQCVLPSYPHLPTCTQPSSAARVSSGPRAAPRRPPKFLELPTCFGEGPGEAKLPMGHRSRYTTVQPDHHDQLLPRCRRPPACGGLTCLARGRSATGASSVPHASFHASSALSSA